MSAPSNFGPGSSEFLPTLGAGNRFGIFVFQGVATTLAVPSGYVSGSPLIGINLYTFPSTFASLGVTPGTYVYSWGSGAHADSLTLQIGSATVVPEPASLTLLGFGLVALGARRWQQRRKP